MESLFGNEFDKELLEVETKYTRKVESPIYTPKREKPHILSLCDAEKTKRLIREIEKSNVTKEEKEFLILAAYRHTVFNYSRIADYYASSNKEMQELMEKSALVIIDFEKSIEYGFTKLEKKLESLYMAEINALKAKKENKE